LLCFPEAVNCIQTFYHSDKYACQNPYAEIIFVVVVVVVIVVVVVGAAATMVVVAVVVIIVVVNYILNENYFLHLVSFHIVYIEGCLPKSL
jgi:hypothetical protein